MAAENDPKTANAETKPAAVLQTGAERETEQAPDQADHDVSLGRWRVKYWTASEKRDKTIAEDCRRLTSALKRLSKTAETFSKIRPEENIEEKISAMLSKEPALNAFSANVAPAEQDFKSVWKRIKSAAVGLFMRKSPEKELAAALKNAAEAVRASTLREEFCLTAQKYGSLSLETLIKAGAAIEKKYRGELGRDRYERAAADDLIKNAQKKRSALQNEAGGTALRSKESAALSPDETEPAGEKTLNQA